MKQGECQVMCWNEVEPAQTFFLATIVSKIDKTIWVVCPSVHSQELLYESLLNWQPDALFLPEAEFAAIENILPDPEIAAERLAVLTQLERQQSPQLIIVTRASLDQAAPRPSALQTDLILLRPGTNEKMEAIFGHLAGAS